MKQTKFFIRKLSKKFSIKDNTNNTGDVGKLKIKNNDVESQDLSDGIMVRGNGYLFTQKLTKFLSTDSVKVAYKEGEGNHIADFLRVINYGYNTGGRTNKT